MEYDEGRQNRQVDEDACGALVIQMPEYAIPEKVDDGRECGGNEDKRSPPGLPDEDPGAGGHERDGGQYQILFGFHSLQFVTEAGDEGDDV